jgi:hypothetical protein
LLVVVLSDFFITSIASLLKEKFIEHLSDKNNSYLILQVDSCICNDIGFVKQIKE